MLVCFGSSLQPVMAQTVVDATNGIEFGTNTDDPRLQKGSGNTDLELDIEDGSVFSIYPNSATKPTFMAGEGHESGVVAGKWYRIAKATTATGGLRANAVFSLRDSSTNGSHSNLIFRAGISYNDNSSMGVTVLTHSYYRIPCFTKIRILKGSTYSDQYLEVWTNWGTPSNNARARYSIMDNLSDGAWIPVDWEETAQIPSGFESHEFDVNKLFAVGKTSNVLSVGYDGSVEVGKNATDGTVPLHVTSDGSVVLAKEQGDISMGVFGSGGN